MRIDYEVSERDFVDAQRLAAKTAPIASVRWMRWFIPVYLTGAVIFLTYGIATQGFSLNVLPGLFMCALIGSIPLVNRRAQRKVYAKSIAMHGALSVEATDQGIEFRGPTFTSQVAWSNFATFAENDGLFVLWQHSRTFNIVPKRQLQPEAITEFRDYLSRNIAKSEA